MTIFLKISRTCLSVIFDFDFVLRVTPSGPVFVLGSGSVCDWSVSDIRFGITGGVSIKSDFV